MLPFILAAVGGYLVYDSLKKPVKEYADGGMAKGGMASGGEINKKVKDWYIKTYPSDDLGQEINDKITFKSLWAYMNNGYDVYEVLEVGDSIVRERIFEKLSEVLGVDYNVVYNKWLMSAEDGGMMAKGGEVSKKSVISELLKLGFGKEKAEDLFEEHIDIYEINMEDASAKDIAMQIEEQYNQEYADGGMMAKGGITPDENKRLTELQEKKDELKKEELDISMGVKSGKKEWEKKMSAVNEEINYLLKKKYGWKKM
jgi:hypothetical protein